MAMIQHLAISQHRLLSGSLLIVIPNAEASYREYLNSPAPSDGYLDEIAWQQLRFAEILCSEVPARHHQRRMRSALLLCILWMP